MNFLVYILFLNHKSLLFYMGLGPAELTQNKHCHSFLGLVLGKLKV